MFVLVRIPLFGVKPGKMFDEGVVNGDSFEMIARAAKQTGTQFTGGKWECQECLTNEAGARKRRYSQSIN